jgi:serine/threonine protein kinase
MNELEIRARVGQGPDGHQILARDASTQEDFSIHILRRKAFDDRRWDQYNERWKRLQERPMMGARKIVQLQLDQKRPVIVLDGPGSRSMADWLSGAGGPRSNPIKVLGELYARLLDAHLEGFALGHLDPSAISTDPKGRVRLDLCGVQTHEVSWSHFDDAERSVQPPPDPSDDVYLFAELVLQHFDRDALPANTLRVLDAMLELDPDARPLLSETTAAFLPFFTGDNPEVTSEVVPVRTAETQSERRVVVDLERRIGPYVLKRLLGEGGMGQVHLALDEKTGRQVAIKTLHAEADQNPAAIRRFRMEARLLSSMRHDNIANLVTHGKVGEMHYLVMEFVQGHALTQVLRDENWLTEVDALKLVGDVARGLSQAHGRGILHRDLKPGNVLVQGPDYGAKAPRLKATLCDFGIGLSLLGEEAEDRMTEEGTILGTPLYMSPEQCGGERNLLPASDIYALGATLFEMLAGRPPFQKKSALELVRAHIAEKAPRLETFRKDLSAGTADLVARCLAKNPGIRPPDAGALFSEIRAIQRGSTGVSQTHPVLPEPAARDLVVAHVQVPVDVSARDLWPEVSDTNQFNRALGLPEIRYEFDKDADGVVRLFGEARLGGFASRWLENPFEWVEGKRFSVVRNFEKGPLRWYASAVELDPVGANQTLVHHRLWLAPRNAITAAAAKLELKLKTENRIQKVYAKIGSGIADSKKQGKVNSSSALVHLDPTQERYARACMDRLEKDGVSPEQMNRLGKLVTQAPAEKVAQIRPRVFAKELDVDLDEALALLSAATAAGLLSPLWAVICPGCQIPASIFDSMDLLSQHGSCDACGIEFDAFVDENIEFFFRAHADIRNLFLGTYCIGGPHHSRHVLAQVRLGARETFQLNLPLEKGTYRLRGGQADWQCNFRVSSGGEAPPHLLSIEHQRAPAMPDRVAPGHQVFLFENREPEEMLVRVERVVSRREVLTLAEVLSHPAANTLLGGEGIDRMGAMAAQHLTAVVFRLDPGEVAVPQRRKIFSSLGEIAQKSGGFGQQVDRETRALFFWSIRQATDMMVALAQSNIPLQMISGSISRAEAWVAVGEDEAQVDGAALDRAVELLEDVPVGEIEIDPAVATDGILLDQMERVGFEASVAGHLGGDGGSEVEMVVRVQLKR